MCPIPRMNALRKPLNHALSVLKSGTLNVQNTASTDTGGCGGGSSGWIFLSLSVLGLRRKTEH